MLIYARLSYARLMPLSTFNYSFKHFLSSLWYIKKFTSRILCIAFSVFLRRPCTVLNFPPDESEYESSEAA